MNRTIERHLPPLQNANGVTPPVHATIVLADDDIATRMLLSRILTRASFFVCAVENGALACDAIRLRQPDIILLDWSMPVMDGPQAAQALKADLTTRAIPILMLTTHSLHAERLLALRCGVADFLTKPFNAVELVERIRFQMAAAKAAGLDSTPPQLPPYCPH